MHWDGAAWKQQSSPSPGDSFSQLGGVAATSATNAWAVGFSSQPTALIVHWDGTAWKQQSSPVASVGGVAVTSATNAWAVGAYSKGGRSHTLALHCC